MKERCLGCQVEFKVKDMVDVQVDEIPLFYCRECFDKKFHYCPICKDFHIKDNTVTFSYKNEIYHTELPKPSRRKKNKIKKSRIKGVIWTESEIICGKRMRNHMKLLKRIKIAKELLEEKEYAQIVKRHIIESLCNLQRKGNLDSIIEVIIGGLKKIALLSNRKKIADRDCYKAYEEIEAQRSNSKESEKCRKRKEEIDKEIEFDLKTIYKNFKEGKV